MVELIPVAFQDIQHWFVDFQKKSKCFEIPPEESEFIGIYTDQELVGYFVLVGYDDGVIDINQGYLKPSARHTDLPKECLKLIESACSRAGYKEIKLGTHNRFKSYLEFMKDNGYKPEHLIFSKRI